VSGPLAERAAYCASNAGIVGFARECAREFAAYGIRVNTVLPGVMVGETAVIAEPAPPQRASQARTVANTVLFLCAQASSSITGSTITVDEGLRQP
jgi:NAD(P)-dependent dehydrogenase (short-subunit alcohol dehydrogenase family)